MCFLLSITLEPAECVGEKNCLMTIDQECSNEHSDEFLCFFSFSMVIKQFFSSMHTSGSRDGKQKKRQITSKHIKSYIVPAQPYGRHKKMSLPQGTSGQVGLLKSPIK